MKRFKFTKEHLKSRKSLIFVVQLLGEGQQSQNFLLYPIQPWDKGQKMKAVLRLKYRYSN